MGWMNIFKRHDKQGYTYLIFFLLFINPLVESLNLQFGIPIPYSVLDNMIFLNLAAMTVLMARKINDFSFENAYARLIICIYLAYQLSIILRVFPLEGDEKFKYFITAQHVMWPMVIPFVYFYDKNMDSLMQMTRTLFLMGVIFLCITILDYPIIKERPTGEPFISCLTLSIGFVALNIKYLSARNRIITLLAVLISLVACTLLARRSMVVTYSFFLLFSMFMLFKSTRAATLIKSLPFIAILICILIANSEFVSLKLTEKFRERLNEDTRSYVFENFFKSMENDMVFGKGMNGKYYSPIDETFAADGMRYDDIEFRNIIENGYLQSMLTGGIVNVVLFLLALLPAAFLGIFKSRNDFTRACGLTVLLFTVDMITFGLPRLTTQYFLVWIAAGICYKKSIREKEHEEWQEQFCKYRLG